MRPKNIKQFKIEKLSALIKIARHLGYMETHIDLARAKKDQCEHLFENADVFLILSFIVLFRKDSSDIQRSACASIIEILWPEWKDNVAKSIIGSTVKRSSQEVSLWRSEVLTRDGFACVNCGSSENLEAHHIVRWVDAQFLRINVDNGKTLCKKCHDACHAKES